MANLAAVAIGGAVGAGLRHLAVVWLGRSYPGFPWGTLCVNVAGSAAMGLLAVLLIERLPGSYGRLAPLLMTGVLGGFTTFSAFSLDAVFLLERGRVLSALGYMLGSVALSVGGLWLGLVLGRRVLAP